MPKAIFIEPLAEPRDENARLSYQDLRSTLSDVYAPAKNAGRQPRLIDVSHESGFNTKTDCSDLRANDAMLTVIHQYGNGLLDKFLDYGNDRVKFSRFSHRLEEYDLEITRNRNFWFCNLIEKDVFGQRKKENYMTLAYDNGPCPLCCGKPRVWVPQLLGGTAFPSSDPILDAVEVETKGSRVARYILLARPWEETDEVMLVGTRDDHPGWDLRGP